MMKAENNRLFLLVDARTKVLYNSVVKWIFSREKVRIGNIFVYISNIEGI